MCPIVCNVMSFVRRARFSVPDFPRDFVSVCDVSSFEISIPRGCRFGNGFFVCSKRWCSLKYSPVTTAVGIEQNNFAEKARAEKGSREGQWVFFSCTPRE